MIYIDQNLRIPGIRPDAPSIEAAAYLGDRIGAAEADARAKAQDVAAARKAADAIKEIAQIDFTPAVAAQLIAVLSNRVNGASWAHFKFATEARDFLNAAHDFLEAV